MKRSGRHFFNNTNGIELVLLSHMYPLGRVPIERAELTSCPCRMILFIIYSCGVFQHFKKMWQRRKRLESMDELEASFDKCIEELAVARDNILQLLERMEQNAVRRAEMASQHFHDLDTRPRIEEAVLNSLLEENDLLKLRVAELQLEISFDAISWKE
ncbi:hypothetical protein ARMGADRAFT_1029679 [Armillaria gallica]|uniref:Uncharacterized protein n=1 Tax=Armillaria gallica TaxID=47427 RepID=A0A2H3DQQ3_ARMGA|nr:hypothetical protein ARMGADRAFT_1029679 [Armillaria gallica]